MKDKTPADFIESFHLGPVALPAVSGFFQAGPRDRREPPQGGAICASQGLCARARFLRRHVRDPRRQGRRSRRRSAPRARGRSWWEPHPTRAPTFFDKLMAKDDGWLASLYDALARIHGPVRDYLTEPARMKRFYAAVRGRITSPGPARPVFRSNTGYDAADHAAAGRCRRQAAHPRQPGSLEEPLRESPAGQVRRQAHAPRPPAGKIPMTFWRRCSRSAASPWKTSRSRSSWPSPTWTATAPPLWRPATVDRLARAYHDYGSQFAIFSESRSHQRQIHQPVPGCD